MRIGNKQLLALLAIGCARIAAAGTVSYTGTLANTQDIFQTTVTLASSGTLSLQTWGFGGGINGDGIPIPVGGFDPLVAVYTGTGPSATLIDGTSDILTDYSSYVGCPPAGTVTIGTIAGNCGDIQMTFSLAAGAYTILLTEGAFIPNAIFDNGTRGEGFTDLTGGVFQTCIDANNCNNDTANWALDVSASTHGSTGAPEPAAWGTACLGLLGLVVVARRRSGVSNPWVNSEQERGGI